MKTVKEAAKDYMKRSAGCRYDLAFIAGSEYAQRWIPVENELPREQYVRCLVDNGNGEYMIGCYTGKYWAFPTSLSVYSETYEVKFWRRIEF